MNNKIDVFMSVPSFQEEDMRGKTVVMIDVLRASSTIVTAIQHGAKGIIPVENMDAAGRISQSLDSPQYLLCGEKDGEKIEGYHLGNSPLEYTAEVVEGKTIILNTTNGTKAVRKAAVAEEVIIGCFLNLKTVVEELKDTERDIALVCAGWRGRLSLEDLLCAGNIIYDLYDGVCPAPAQDGVRVAFELFDRFGDDTTAVIKTSNHAVRLQDIINPEDLAHCTSKSMVDVLPVLKEGIIKNFHGEET